MQAPVFYTAQGGGAAHIHRIPVVDCTKMIGSEQTDNSAEALNTSGKRNPFTHRWCPTVGGNAGIHPSHVRREGKPGLGWLGTVPPLSLEDGGGGELKRDVTNEARCNTVQNRGGVSLCSRPPLKAKKGEPSTPSTAKQTTSTDGCLTGLVHLPFRRVAGERGDKP